MQDLQFAVNSWRMIKILTKADFLPSGSNFLSSMERFWSHVSTSAALPRMTLELQGRPPRYLHRLLPIVTVTMGSIRCAVPLHDNLPQVMERNLTTCYDTSNQCTKRYPNFCIYSFHFTLCTQQYSQLPINWFESFRINCQKYHRIGANPIESIRINCPKIHRIVK